METGGSPDRGTGGRLQVSVVSPEAVLYEGEAASVIAPAYDGLVGILPRHAPMLALLGTGVLTLRSAGGERRFRVGGGFVQVRGEAVRVVAESARSLDGSGEAA